MTEKRARETESRLLEIGWLVIGRPNPYELEMVERARTLALEQVEAAFPQFEWQLTIRTGALPASPTPAEPSLLLQEGRQALEREGWDFCIVIANAELRSYERAHAIAMPSRALSVAVVSMPQLRQHDQAATDDGADAAKRTCHLFMHLLGDLNGVEHRPDRNDFMYFPGAVDDLDGMQRYAEDALESLGAELARVADTRLEELPQVRARANSAFYLKAIWHLRGDILSGVWQAEPWQFPFRFNRLTTAAVSTVLVLIMTAEAWDLGMGQTHTRMIVFSLCILIATSANILRRQRLLVSRNRAQVSEQIVLTNVSLALIVFAGMTTTYLMLLALTLTLAWILFNDALVAGWAASLGEQVVFAHYLVFGELIASLGILIGSLGASFEGQHYFRHVAYVDEEL